MPSPIRSDSGYHLQDVRALEHKKLVINLQLFVVLFIFCSGLTYIEQPEFNWRNTLVETCKKFWYMIFEQRTVNQFYA